MQSAENQADLCGTCSVRRCLYRNTEASAEGSKRVHKTQVIIVNLQKEGLDADLCEGHTLKQHPKQQTMKRKEPQEK